MNSLPAAIGSFTAQTDQGTLAGYVTFVNLDGTTFQILAYTPATLLRVHEAALQRSVTSFRRLTDPSALAVKVQHIRLVRLSQAMTVTAFNQAYPSVIPIAEVALINGVDANATFPAGTVVKRVVAE
jgi:predicted Zn-dependent protease